MDDDGGERGDSARAGADRRAFLRGIGALGVAGLAGCGGDGDGTPAGTTEPTGESSTRADTTASD
jgi:hypothetical protein